MRLDVKFQMIADNIRVIVKHDLSEVERREVPRDEIVANPFGFNIPQNKSGKIWECTVQPSW